MATSPGWAQLGSTIAGGNKLNSALAYDQGESLGAKTQDALAQARARIDENTARQNIGEALKGAITDPGQLAAITGLIQAHQDPAQAFNAQKLGQEVGFRNDIVNPATSDTDVARRALALNQKGPVQQIGEGQVINELHPVDPTTGAPAVVPTAIGTAIAAQHTAAAANQTSEAALHKDQVANPGKYRILPPQAGAAGADAVDPGDGSAPIGDDNTAHLVAAGLMPSPAPGSRSYMMLGGDKFSRRVNFLAGPGGQAGATPPAAPVAPVSPTVPPVAGGAPPAAGAKSPAGADTSGVVLPTEKPAAAPAGPMPFTANFDANAYGQRRTALNDLSRKSGTGGNDDALNRTAGHLDVYEQLMKNSGNTNFVAGNQLKNWYQQQTGKAWPGQAGLAAHVLGTEIIKSMTSVGAGSAEERLGLAEQFKNAQSIDQAMGAITTAQDLLREQAVATNQRVTSSGVKDFYGKYLTPTARRRLSLGEFDASTTPAGATPPAGGPQSFKTEAEAEAAGLKSGTKVVIGGVPGTWQ